MKRICYFCDLCDKEIQEAALDMQTLKAGGEDKQLSPPLVVTLRGDRISAANGKVSIKANINFYIGTLPKSTEELHFHQLCLEQAVNRRFMKYCEGYDDEEQS